MKTKWTEKEIRYLKKNAGKKTYEEISEYLGRTRNSVAMKALKMEKEDLNSETEGHGTLCWVCARAGGITPVKSCAWIEKFEPVKGWTAKKTKLGYHVIKCPKLKRR
jgi:hypothetical protein